MPRFHPDDTTLLEYAAGAMAEPFGVLVASHLTLCPECRAAAARLDAVGGALLAESDPVAPSENALDAVLAGLDTEAPPIPPRPAPNPDWGPMPAPLLDFLQARGRAPRWRRLLLGLSDIDLSPPSSPIRARLMRVYPGHAMPRHSHAGIELQIVLQGSFIDEIGQYGVGDFVSADKALTHKPIADAVTGCICFAVADAPVTLAGPLGRVLNRFIRY